MNQVLSAGGGEEGDSADVAAENSEVEKRSTLFVPDETIIKKALRILNNFKLYG